jgi:flagellar basal-body rod modification protein FlgD
MADNSINGATAANGAGSAAAAGIAANGEIANMFTTLLVAQIKNQNPLEPTDPSAFVNQLTQLSQMEALQKLANQGSANAGMLASLQMLALGGQVGSTVQARVEQLNIDKAPIATRFSLNSTAAQASLVLTGRDGIERRIALGARAAGDNAFSLDPQQLGLPAGVYAVRVETETKELAGIEISAALSSVKLGAGGAVQLALGGSLAEVDPSALTQFNGRGAAQPNN